MTSGDLYERLTRQAEEQAAAILGQASADAAALVAEAEDAARERRAARLAAREAQERADAAAALEQEQLDTRRDLLVARHAVAEAVLERARAALPRLVDDPRYLRAVEGDLARAVEVIAESEATLHAAPSVAAALRRHPRPGVTIMADPNVSGFRLVSPDGRVEVTATLDERLRRLGPRLRIELARELEASEG
jgi:vacuolar-type H+-ATPase subunit E/Vma4